MWDTWSIMVDIRHGSRTAAKRLGAGGPSPGGGPPPWPGRKAFGLRRDGGVLAWELGKPCGSGQINHFLRYSQVKKITLVAFAMPSFQFPVESGKSMLTAVIWRIRHVSIFQSLNSSATNQENHYIPPTCRLFWQDVHSSCHTTVINRFKFFKGQMWDPAQSDQKFQIQWTFATTCLPLMSPMFGYVWSFLTPEFQEAHPSTKVDLLTASTTQHPKAKRKLPARVRTPCITSSEPLPKQYENPSGATAVFVGRVHRGPRRDQLLDHGGVAFPSRVMQRRGASGAEDATRTAGQLRLPSRNKAIVMGCFSGLWGKMWIDHDRS